MKDQKEDLFAEEKQESAVAVHEQKETGIQIISANLENGDIPDLEEAEEYPVDLLSEYWTPEKAGENKKMYFAKIESRSAIGDNEEIKELKTAYFIEKKNGVSKSISNASRRLVGALEDANIKSGMAISITYLGKQKNKTNAFQSDNWSVKPLMLKK